LNELLGTPSPMLVAVIDGSHVRAHVDIAGTAIGADRLTVFGAAVLLATVADVGVDRIGICSAGQCADVYVDRSPRRNRRYCSQLCQTRERVQRHRRRARA
jgi:predicted RNA-binding Zn ribbon-like protein